MNFNPVIWPHAALSSALVIAIQLTAYTLGVDAMVSPWNSLALALTFPLGMSLALVALRREEDHVLSFRRGFFHAWAVAAAMQTAQTAFQLLLYHVLAPDLVAAIVEATLDSMDERLGAFAEALPDSAEFRSELKAALLEGLSVQGLLVSALWGTLFAAAGAAVVALVFRRRPPSQFD